MLRLIILAAFLAAHLSLAKERAVAIQFDPKLSNENVAAIWLGYLLGRAAYRVEHKLPVPASGTIVPSFEEEVYARSGAVQIYQELKQKEKGLRDSYWETLSQIKAKGFMNAYVWTHLRRSHWPKSQEPKPRCFPHLERFILEKSQAADPRFPGRSVKMEYRPRIGAVSARKES